MMTVATPKMIPSSVRNDLSLCALIALSARPIASINFMVRIYPHSINGR